MATSTDFNANMPVCNCRKCGTPMRVFGIERYTTLEGMVLRSHECPHCESLQTDVIPFVQVESERPQGTPSLRPPRFRSGRAMRDSR